MEDKKYFVVTYLENNEKDIKLFYCVKKACNYLQELLKENKKVSLMEAEIILDLS